MFCLCQQDGLANAEIECDERRDKAAALLKEEIAMLHRSDARGSVAVDYVKKRHFERL